MCKQAGFFFTGQPLAGMAVSTSFALLFLSRATKAVANETPGSLSDIMGRLGPQERARVVDLERIVNEVIEATSR